MNTKPGYKTTEFWLAIASTLIGALVILGVITQETANGLTTVVAAVIALAMTYGSSNRYIKSRTVVKQAAYDFAKTQVEPAPVSQNGSTA